MLEFDTGVWRCEVQLALKCRHCDHTPIQGRAVRRIGELLEEFHGGAPNQYTKECGRAASGPAASVTRAAGVSLRQEKTARNVAGVPQNLKRPSNQTIRRRSHSLPSWERSRS